MKFKINKRNLLGQLPDKENWDEVILEGEPVVIVKEVDPLDEVYKDLKDALTFTQWKIFKELLVKGEITLVEILKYCDSPRAKVLGSNNASVHILSLRKKLKQLRPTWQIITARRGYCYWTLLKEE